MMVLGVMLRARCEKRLGTRECMHACIHEGSSTLPSVDECGADSGLAHTRRHASVYSFGSNPVVLAHDRVPAVH